MDATNAFNSINREAALHNISILCPALSTVLCNTYGAPVRLFIVGEGELLSTEGTTQGDPLAMAMYALAVVPLIRQLRHAVSEVSEVSQAWFADDATAEGSLSSLLQWWQHLSSIGPKFGYCPNALKTVLIVKPEYFIDAKSIFADTNIQITDRGQRHLGATLGSRTYAEEYVTQKVTHLAVEVIALVDVATTRPCHMLHIVLLHMEWLVVGCM